MTSRSGTTNTKGIAPLEDLRSPSPGSVQDNANKFKCDAQNSASDDAGFKVSLDRRI